MSRVVQILHASHWLAALLLCGLTLHCLRKKGPAVRALAWFCALAGMWALLAAVIAVVPDFATKVALNRLKLLAPTLLPLSLLGLGFALYGKRSWHRLAWLLFALVPLTTTVLLASGTRHTSFVGAYRIVSLGGRELLAYSNGPWFSFHNFNARLAAFLTIILLWKARRDLSTIHRYRVWIMFVAILVPFVADTIAVHFLEELRYVQIAPTMLLFSAVLFIYAVFHRHFIDVIPFARAQILDGTDDLYLIADAESVLLDFNARAGLALRLDRSNIGCHLTDLAAHHPDVERLMNLCGEKPAEWTLGEDVYEVQKRPMTDSRSGRLGLILSCKNITLRKQTEKALADLNQVKTKLLAIMGHDFQGNLATSLIIAQNLGRHHQTMSHEDTAQSCKNLEVIARQNIALVEDLLHWSKHHLSGRRRPELVDLSVLTAGVCAFFEPMARSHGVSIEHHWVGSMEIHSDAAAINTILRNFLSNAIKASPAKAFISIAMRQNTGDIEIVVEDRGCGIAPEQMAHLFQLEQERCSGIGLYLCREFAEYIGGQVGVESELGRGSKFMLSLPRSH